MATISQMQSQIRQKKTDISALNLRVQEYEAMRKNVSLSLDWVKTVKENLVLFSEKLNAGIQISYDSLDKGTLKEWASEMDKIKKKLESIYDYCADSIEDIDNDIDKLEKDIKKLNNDISDAKRKQEEEKRKKDAEKKQTTSSKGSTSSKESTSSKNAKQALIERRGF